MKNFVIKARETSADDLISFIDQQNSGNFSDAKVDVQNYLNVVNITLTLQCQAKHQLYCLQSNFVYLSMSVSGRFRKKGYKNVLL